MNRSSHSFLALTLKACSTDRLKALVEHVTRLTSQVNLTFDPMVFEDPALGVKVPAFFSSKSRLAIQVCSSSQLQLHTQHLLIAAMPNRGGDC